MSISADTAGTDPTSPPHTQAAFELTPGQLLRQAKRLMDQAQKLVDQAVIAERAKGTSWETIGEVLDGVTKSAAQKRYGPRFNSWVGEAENDGFYFTDSSGSANAERMFSHAYKELEDEWKAAGEIVETQDLIAELSNATTALSGANDSPVFRSLNPEERRWLKARTVGLYPTRRCFTYAEEDHKPDPPAHLDGTLLLSLDGLWEMKVAHSNRSVSSFTPASHALRKAYLGKSDGSHREATERRKSEDTLNEALSLEDRVTALEHVLARFLTEGGEAGGVPAPTP